MFEALQHRTRASRHVKLLLERAGEEARAIGAPALEAEHILLALAGGTDEKAARVLSSLGVSRTRIIEGLDREFAAALAGVDIQLTAPGGGPRRPNNDSRMPWGPSAARAAGRSIGESPDDPGLRMLLAIVHAEAGLIPHLLAELGITVGEVETAVLQVDADDK